MLENFIHVIYSRGFSPSLKWPFDFELAAISDFEIEKTSKLAVTMVWSRWHHGCFHFGYSNHNYPFSVNRTRFSISTYVATYKIKLDQRCGKHGKCTSILWENIYKHNVYQVRLQPTIRLPWDFRIHFCGIHNLVLDYFRESTVSERRPLDGTWQRSVDMDTRVRGQPCPPAGTDI